MADPLDGRRAYSIMIKEIRHILRDPFILGLALGLPLLMVMFFGLAMDFSVRDIHLAVFDEDRSSPSRELAGVFEDSGFFHVELKPMEASPSEALDSGHCKAALLIPPGFSRDLKAKGFTTAQVLVDGADNSVAGVLSGYLAGIQQAAVSRLKGGAMAPPVALKTRYLFNPELNSRWFTVPGLSAVVLAIISILLTALTVAREWENGSMELILTTPVHPFEIIIGKLAPYLILGLGAQGLIYVLARGYFHVPFVGSHAVFLLGSVLFTASYMAMGLLISVATRQQMLAMQMSMMIGMLPTMLLSGFIYPVESMPVFFQYFTRLLPARWFMVVIRGVFLRGAGLDQLALPLLALAGFATLFVTLAARRFKKDLEP